MREPHELWCLAAAGAGASFYRAWRDVVPPTVRIRAIELPGRGARFAEPVQRRVGPLVAQLADEVAGELRAPFALFGHSFGALVAFELARELRRRALPQPRRLFVAGRPAPDDGVHTRTRLHALDRAAFVEVVHGLGMLPDEVLANRELLELVLGPLRADFEASETFEYVTEPPLGFGISAFRGQRELAYDVEGWRRQTADGFRVRELPGGHFFVRTAPELVVAAIVEDLEAASAR